MYLLAWNPSDLKGRLLANVEVDESSFTNSVSVLSGIGPQERLDEIARQLGSVSLASSGSGSVGDFADLALPGLVCAFSLELYQELFSLGYKASVDYFWFEVGIWHRGDCLPYAMAFRRDSSSMDYVCLASEVSVDMRRFSGGTLRSRDALNCPFDFIPDVEFFTARHRDLYKSIYVCSDKFRDLIVSGGYSGFSFWPLSG